MSVVAKPEVHANNDVLSGLDSFGQNPLEALMEQMRKDIRVMFLPTVENLLTVEHLATRLSDEDKSKFLTLISREKRLDELVKNPLFPGQEAAFMKLSQDFEKKGMTEENTIAFAKRAEEKCPLAFEYATIMMEIAPIKDVLSALLIEVFFKSLEKMNQQSSVKQ